MPQLIALHDVLPREIEVGDKLEISGDGLPQGRTARVTFRGELHRPGEATSEHVEIGTEGEVTSEERVEITYTSDLQSEFCGSGSDIAHTTFEGSVEVAFAATTIGAPPVAATLAHATLDFRPPLPATSAAMREGERLTVFAGFRLVDQDAHGAGLGVAAVDPGSRADGAGLRDGDEIESFNGVRALSVADLAVIEGLPTATLTVRRAGGSENLTMHLEGFRPAPTADRFALLALLALFIAAVVVRASPASARLAAMARRAHARGATLAQAPIAGWSKKTGVFASSVILTAGLMALPCAVEAFPLHADAPTVFGAVMLASVTIALVTHGFLRGLRVAAWHLVMALAVVGIVVLSGSLRVSEIASAQGGAPWTWNAFQGPAGLALAATYLAAALASTVIPMGQAADFSLDLERAAAAPPLGLGDAFRLALACSLAVPLFVGRLHVGTPRSLSLAVAFVVAGALFWAVAALRAVASARWLLREIMPASAFALALAFAQASLHLDRRIETILGVVMFAAVVLAFAHLLTIVRAVWHQARRPAAVAQLRPSPFL